MASALPLIEQLKTRRAIDNIRVVLLLGEGVLLLLAARLPVASVSVPANNDPYAAARQRGQIVARSYLTLYHARGCIFKPSR